MRNLKWACFCCSLVLYAWTATYSEFILQDMDVIKNSEAVRVGGTRSVFASDWTMGLQVTDPLSDKVYRPLSLLLFKLLMNLWTTPSLFAFRVTLILLNCLVSVAAVDVLQILMSSAPAPTKRKKGKKRSSQKVHVHASSPDAVGLAVAALMFSCHPVRSETVAVGVVGVGRCCATLAAFLSFKQYHQGHADRSVLLLLLASFFNESLLGLFLPCLLLELYKVRRPRSARNALLMAACCLARLLAVRLVVGAPVSHQSSPLAHHLITAASHVWRLVFPWGLSVHYAPPAAPSAMRVAVSVCTLLLPLLAALWYQSRKGLLLPLVFHCALTLGQGGSSDRLLYGPSVAFCALLGVLAGSRRPSWLRWVAAVLILLAFFRTAARVHEARGELPLLTSSDSAHPSARVKCLLASLLLQQQQPPDLHSCQRAQLLLLEAARLDIHSGRPEALLSVLHSTAESPMHDSAVALRYARLAYQLAEGDARTSTLASYALGRALLDQGLLQEATEVLLLSGLDPQWDRISSTRAACLLGVAYYRRKLYPKAVEAFERCVARDARYLRPDARRLAAHYVNLGAACQTVRNYDRALKAYEDALLLDPRMQQRAAVQSEIYEMRQLLEQDSS